MSVSFEELQVGQRWESTGRAFSLKPGRFGLSDTRSLSPLANAAGCRTVGGMLGESALGTLAALKWS